MLNDEMNRMGEGGGGMKKVIVKSVVVDALVAMSTDFEKYFAAIGIELKKNMHKKTASDSEDFETDTWMLKNSIISISNIEHSSVRPWTTGCCLLSQN